MIGEEAAGCVVVELAVVVRLNSNEGKAKLCQDEGMKASDHIKSFRFEAHGESPCKVAVIVKENQIVFIT